MKNKTTITVCAECLTASCWHGEFMCDRAKSANLVEKTREQLAALALEHPDNYSEEKLRAIYGDAP